jgi:membrane associated rhomboid family serine protease
VHRFQWWRGIAHFAHVGGALFGFIIMWYWKKISSIKIDGIKVKIF